MFGDLWDSNVTKTKKTILADFDQKAIQPKSKRRGQADAIMKIERFVDMVLQSKKPAYAFKKKHPDQFRKTHVGQRLKEVLPLVRQFDSYHLYTSSPALFFRAYWLISRIYGFRLSKPMHQVVRPDLSRADVMNLFIEQIRFEASQLWYQRLAYDRKYEAKEKAEALVEYAKAILSHYRKTLVVRVDLGYEGGASAPVDIDQVLHDFHSMLECRHCFKPFKHLVGYAWTVEQSERKGFHIHAIFFFDGSEVRQDVTLGFAIGNLWRNELTRGRGTFHNCNAFKDRYERCGIGMIHRNSAEECSYAMEFVQYLAKGGPFLDRDDQYLRIRPQGARAFGTGWPPESEVGHLGRPRGVAPWNLQSAASSQDDLCVIPV